MRSKTSFFNLTIFRHDLKRYWPLWGSCLFLCVILLPLVNLYNPGNSTVNILRNMGWGVSIVINAVFSVLIAMAVFSPLYSTKAGGFYAALPVRRESWFLSSWCSGFAMLAGCGVVTALLMLGVELSQEDVELAETLRWLGLYLLLTCFFYGLSSLCALLTGTLWVVPLLYAAVNFIAYLLWLAVSYLCDMLVSGWISVEPALCTWLTPIVRITATEGENELWVPVIYALIGLLLAAEALLRMKKRRMENATDIVAVRALKPLFRWAGGLCGGLFAGVILYAIFLDEENHVFQMLLFQFIGVLIGWFGAEMLNQRSFRVWKRYPGFLICTALLLGFTLCCSGGCFGYESYIPAEEDIARVELEDYAWGLCISEDPQDIREFIALHEDIRSRENRSGYDMRVCYTLKNGKAVQREYVLAWDDFTERENALLRRMTVCGLRETVNAYERCPSGSSYITLESGGEYLVLSASLRGFVEELVIPGIERGEIDLCRSEKENLLEIAVSLGEADDYRYTCFRFCVSGAAAERVKDCA